MFSLFSGYEMEKYVTKMIFKGQVVEIRCFLLTFAVYEHTI